MAYALVNLGRKRTTSRTVPVLLSKTGISGTTTYRYRINGGSYSVSKPYAPYVLIDLGETIGVKAVDVSLTDGVTTIVASSNHELVEENPPGLPWYPETQSICNNLPEWHIGRRLRTSGWQQFINGAYGQSMTEVSNASISSDNSKFLDRCPVNEMDIVGRIWVDNIKLNTEKDKYKNLIKNPTFSVIRNPFGEPEHWALSATTADGNWSFSNSKSIYGRGSLKAVINDSERATIVQPIDVELDTGELLTATVFNQTVLSGSTAISGIDYNIRIVLVYEDGTSASFTSNLDPETDSRWNNTSVIATATQKSYQAFVVVNLDGIASIDPHTNYIGAVTANYGSKANDFSFGTTKHFNQVNPFFSVLEPSQEIWLTDSDYEFWQGAIPTRAGVASDAVAVDTTADAIATKDFYIPDALKQVHPMGFIAAGGKARFIHEPTQSTIIDYNLAFYDQGVGGYVENENFYVEATTFFNDRLWCVGYFIDQDAIDTSGTLVEYDELGTPVDGDNRVRYLCLIKHLMPASPTTYLECLASWQLRQSDIDESVVKVLFPAGDPQWVRYYTEDETRYNRLYYDYGLAKIDGSVLIREPQEHIAFG